VKALSKSVRFNTQRPPFVAIGATIENCSFPRSTIGSGSDQRARSPNGIQERIGANVLISRCIRQVDATPSDVNLSLALASQHLLEVVTYEQSDYVPGPYFSYTHPNASGLSKRYSMR
jgi:hypothetical protein